MDKKSARFRLGRGIKEMRGKCGWTQEKLAMRARISKRYLQAIESNNPPNVTLDTIKKISDAFKRGLPDLF